MLAKVSLLLLAASCCCCSALIPTAGANGLRPMRSTTRSNHQTRPPLDKRSDIASDAVVGFDTTVPDDTEGTLMETWWPYLYVVDGCVPFPAVDAEGDTRLVFDTFRTCLLPEPYTYFCLPPPPRFPFFFL